MPGHPASSAVILAQAGINASVHGALRQAVSGGASWFRGSPQQRRTSHRCSWPGLRRTTRSAPLRALRSIKCGESEPATSSLRYAIDRARSAPALLKIGPAGHRLPL
jgi:hypothetical protein